MSEPTTNSEVCDPASVTILVRAGMAIVTPHHEEVLRPVLSYKELAFRPNPESGLQRISARKQVCDREGEGLIIAIGCIPRAARHLTQAGYTVQVHDDRDRTEYPYAIDERYLADAESIVPGLASAIECHMEGILEAGIGNQKTQVLGCMCQLFHSAKIFIACKTIEATRSIAVELGPYLGGEVEAVKGWNWRSACRVVCGTFGSLDRSEPADWQILIFADAFEGIHKANWDARADYRHRRIYALVDSRRPRSPREELLFETLAGPVIYRAPQRRQRPATEFLAAFATHASCSAPSSGNARDRRFALWHDVRRNQAIADVAIGLSCGRDATLWDHEILPAGEQALSALEPQSGVIVIVDGIEHGEQLHRLLPGWHFLNGRPTSDRTVTGALSASVWGSPRNSIVTAVIANSLLSFDCRILIWASGGCVPFIPTRLGRSWQSHFLIDFWDDGDNQLAADTRQRLGVYKSIGCRLVGGKLDQRERSLAQAGTPRNPDSHRNTSHRRCRSHLPSV